MLEFITKEGNRAGRLLARLSCLRVGLDLGSYNRDILTTVYPGNQDSNLYRCSTSQPRLSHQKQQESQIVGKYLPATRSDA